MKRLEIPFYYWSIVGLQCCVRFMDIPFFEKHRGTWDTEIGPAQFCLGDCVCWPPYVGTVGFSVQRRGREKDHGRGGWLGFSEDCEEGQLGMGRGWLPREGLGWQRRGGRRMLMTLEVTH